MSETPSELLIKNLDLRLNVYKVQLKSSIDENNSSKIRRYKRIICQYEKCINDATAGKYVALVELPNPPGFPPLVDSPAGDEDNDNTVSIATSEDPNEQTFSEPLPATEKCHDDQPLIKIEEPIDDQPKNVIEALSDRLNKYEIVLKAAEDEEGAAAKVRRYKRIISQYKEAIKNLKNGKNVNLEELPNPPGMPPLVPRSSPLPSPSPSPHPSPVPARANPSATSGELSPVAPLRPAPPVPGRVITRADKQTALLRERQKEYREAAINAKRAGQIPEAMEFLKICKGFDRLINASESGLPVDVSTIPVSLRSVTEAEDAFVLVSEKDFAESSDSDVFAMIKNELQEQLKSCMTRRNQLKSVGDVANANRFEQWALTFKKDLTKVSVFQSGGQPVPKFHYNQFSFPILHCFSDVSAGEVEMSIVQAVGLPKAGDTYVGYEFPYPSDAPPSGYTHVVKNSDNPLFDFTTNFPIDRDNKQCQRMFKRQGQSGVKLEVWARGGFLRRDASLGTVVVKLLPLTTDLMIHDAFDLMNGRRPAGGKLEVKIRVREPLFAKKIETITEKWLVLD